LIGGAAINREFGRRIALIDGERVFAPGLFTPKTPLRGSIIMEQLVVPAKRDVLVEEMRAGGRWPRGSGRPTHPRRRPIVARANGSRKRTFPTRRPSVRARSPISTSPNCGRTSICAVCIAYRGADRSVKGAQWEALVRDEFEPRLRRFRALAQRSPLLAPKVVYGYFPAAGDGDDVVIYDPADIRVEIARLRFTRQSGGQHLCLADYLRNRDRVTRSTSSRCKS